MAERIESATAAPLEWLRAALRAAGRMGRLTLAAAATLAMLVVIGVRGERGVRRAILGGVVLSALIVLGPSGTGDDRLG